MSNWNFADLYEGIASRIPDHPCQIQGDRVITWGEFDSRTNALTADMLAAGLTHQSKVAEYLYNCPEYLETYIASFKGGFVPANTNYRYGPEEVTYLFDNSDAEAVVFHAAFVPLVDSIRNNLPKVKRWYCVADGTHDVPSWATDYEVVVSKGIKESVRGPWGRSEEDLMFLYTGGTTGMPKGVMWRQGDALVECFGGSRTAASVDDFLAETKGRRALVAPPFMHGAGHWVAFGSWNAGGTVFVPSIPERLDAHDIWSMVEQEKIDFLLIVGDAFARPLIDELKLQSYDLSTLTVIISGGAALSAHYKDELLELVPHLMIIDGLGSSEAGGQLTHMSAAGGASTGTFPLAPNNHVLSSDYSEVLQPGHIDAGHPEAGWLAKSGRLALGYLGDAEKTAKTYPVINGVRYVVPGDRAVLTSDGLVEMRGRDSVTINSGGEKIFAEEVEMAVKSHPAVLDCVVTGRPSERWGNEVVAIVHLRANTSTTHQELIEEAAKHIARYKLPKEFIYVDHIVRSPSGKADYRWAKSIANPA